MGSVSFEDKSYRSSIHCVCIVLGIIKASCCVFHNVLDSGRPSKAERCKPVALACVCLCGVISALGLTAQLYLTYCRRYYGVKS